VKAPSVVTAYEDRPIHELLKAHLAPLCGSVADSPGEADLSLFLNAPVYQQGNGDSQWVIEQGLEAVRGRMPAVFHAWFDEFTGTAGFRATRREMESPHRSPEEFVRALLATLASGRPAALADVAFVNAADLILGDLLRLHPSIVGLAAFGGWNTAGNTLGTVLAQAVIRVLAGRGPDTRDQRAAHLEFLFLRLLDDDSYQGRVRSRCIFEDLPAMGISPTMERLPDDRLAAVEERVREHLGREAAALRDLFIRSGAVRDVRVRNIHLPWRRLFEVGFDVEVVLD
jgi:hypothetical protein